MRALTINVDMDGVVYGMVERFAKLAIREGLTYDCPAPTRWDFYADWMLEADEFWRAFHWFTQNDGLFRDGEALPGAIDGLKALRKAGHRVRIVTAKTLREPASTTQARIDTIKFLAQHGLADLEVVFTGGHAKQGFPADVVIDDKPNLEWAQSRPTLNILYGQPWNVGVVYPRHLRLIRVDDWRDVVAMVNREAERRAVAGGRA